MVSGVLTRSSGPMNIRCVAAIIGEGGDSMRRSGLGDSAVGITELSFGAAAIGNLFSEVEPERAAAAVDAAWDVGIRYFDTAPHYGLGLSERRLGEALRHRPRDAYTLSTKVGRILDPSRPGREPPPTGSPRASPYAPRTAAAGTSAPPASAAASRTASTASASTASTSPTSTIPTTTPNPPSARRTRNWRSCAPKGSSGRSARA